MHWECYLLPMDISDALRSDWSLFIGRFSDEKKYKVLRKFDSMMIVMILQID